MKRIVIPFLLLSVFFLTGCGNDTKLVCDADEGNITLYYDEDSVNGYSANGFNYDMEEQNEYVTNIGMESYILEFTAWFEENTTGTCIVEE